MVLKIWKDKEESDEPIEKDIYLRLIEDNINNEEIILYLCDEHGKSTSRLLSVSCHGLFRYEIMADIPIRKRLGVDTIFLRN